jgi:hypothetical protein
LRNNGISKLAAFDFALPPTERLGALVMSPEESFNGVTRPVFGQAFQFSRMSGDRPNI